MSNGYDIYEYLKKNHIGKENAVFSKELEQRFSLSDRSLRRVISALRREGCPICSGCTGYYLGKTQKDVENTVAWLGEMAEGISEAKDSMERIDLKPKKEGETGIIMLEPGKEYTNKDGKKVVPVNAKKVFDISQTSLPFAVEPYVKVDEKLLFRALINNAPCRFWFADPEDMPRGEIARFSEADNTVYVVRGEDPENTFRWIARELAAAHLRKANYDKDKVDLLSTMRSREISVSIIIQNMAQLKALYEKQWESITGNCDEFLYLGGNEQSTHEYVSKLLGKETIDLNTYGQSKGRSGTYSTNWQLTGRELLTPDEVRLLDNRYALLFIRGERPVKDLKYNTLRHPNVALTTDGGAEPFRHGEDALSIASVSLENIDPESAEVLDVGKHDYLIFTEEELEEEINKKLEEQLNEQKK